MPSGPIQTLPVGLLSLLQLKNLGVNPQVLADIVQPVVDMEPWWLRQESSPQLQVPTRGITQAEGAGAKALVTGAPTEFVPQNEWWFVQHATMRITAATIEAEASFAGFGYIEPAPTANNGQHVLMGGPVPGSTGQVMQWFSCEGVWIPPGVQLVWYVGEILPAVGSSELGFALTGFRYAPLRF